MLEVGTGRAVITPPLPVALAGFGEPQLATEVHDDLEARALYLRGPDGVAVCLVVCDLLGMSPEFEAPARQAVAAAIGLDASAVLIACTHTHSGPSAMRGTAALGWVTPEGYGELLADGCRAAAVDAAASARAATVRYGRSPLPGGLSINRRGHPYDPWFAMLELSDSSDGAPLAVLANLGVHPVALGPECLAVSADWVAPFRDELSRRVGADTLMLSSALGDVNPNHVHRQNNDCRNDGFAEAAELGEELAEVVDSARNGAETIDGGVGVVADRHVTVPIGGTPLAAGRRSSTLHVELLEWSIGPIRVVSIPGEAFHALGREIDESRGGRTILAGLAPHWRGYLPVPYVEGGYEENTSFGPAAVEEIRKNLLDVPDPGRLR
ncbi:MAG TPA: hypothetical protein VM345_03270 [Acidimicrobiales bacterium]|jgi:neutral ceramidase|nr:hypothetical protein [Acidimicrobiales bacterium]